MVAHECGVSLRDCGRAALSKYRHRNSPSNRITELC
jgi:hypothetical protein